VIHAKAEAATAADPTINALIDGYAATARKHVIKDGGLAPHYILRIGPVMLPVAADFTSQTHKEQVIAVIRLLATAYWPQSIAFIAETWLSTKVAPDGSPAYPQPSQDPDHQEGVMVIVATPTEERARLLKLQYNDDGTVIDLIPTDLELGEISGPLTGLYPAIPPNAKQQTAAQDHVRTHLGNEIDNLLLPHAGRPTSSAKH
jgi:hypothetical protein